MDGYWEDFMPKIDKLLMSIEKNVVRHNLEKLSVLKQEINKVKLEEEEDGGIMVLKQNYVMSALERDGFKGDLEHFSNCPIHHKISV
jgi:hypothetical protein